MSTTLDDDHPAVSVAAFLCAGQARSRVNQLLKLGHVVDKVEFILMGGTFMSLPPDYRDYFVRNLHDALSGEGGAVVRVVHLSSARQMDIMAALTQELGCCLQFGIHITHFCESDQGQPGV